ncbi:MAG: DNA translocase FtsK 4TM domain-containing protein [Bacteroidota bacterium]
MVRRENLYKKITSFTSNPTLTKRQGSSSGVKDRTSKKRKIWRIKSLFQFLKNERLQKVTGLLFLFIFTPYLLIAFTSYLFTWDNDYDVVMGSWTELLFNSDYIVDNWLGKLGAIISHLFIYNWFGITSFIFILLFAITGFRILFKISLLPVKRTFKYSFFALIWLSVALGYVFQNITISREVQHLMGGAFGVTCNGWLDGLLGNIGTGFFITFIFMCFLIISFNISFNWFKSKIKEDLPLAEKSIDDFSAEPASPGSIKLESDYLPGEIQSPDSTGKVVETGEQEGDILQGEFNSIQLSGDDKIQGKDKDIELIIEESKEDDTLPPEEVDSKSEFGEYDPKLDLSSYELPHIDLLEDYGSSEIKVDTEELETNKDRIVETLANYSIGIDKIKATIGPTVTLYEIVPAPGIRISKIKNLEDDIALSLSALGIRIIAPIPGKGTIGIEVPNRNPEIVSIRSILSSEKFRNSKAELPIGLGKTISNETFIADLAKMPHLLMAGATGQGKSVGLNAIMVSLLYKKHPSQVKFVLIDTKRVELTLYKKIERHFLAKLPDAEEAIVSDTKKVVKTLKSLCNEMDIRYKLLHDAQERSVDRYNAKFISRKLNPENGHRYLPYIIVVIDEFADLIMIAGKEIEGPLTRLAQLARAIGIHLVIATQRPSVNIITGTIKANFPVRISFRVVSKIDSKTIIDSSGADQLIGKGDMLLSMGSDLIRLQCAFVDTPEVEKVNDFIGSQRGYPEAFLLPEYEEEGATEAAELGSGERDPEFEAAARIIVQHQHGSASLLQRRLKLGYNRAGRIIDQLEAEGVIGPFEGSKARQVLIPDEYSLEQFLRIKDEDKED